MTQRDQPQMGQIEQMGMGLMGQWLAIPVGEPVGRLVKSASQRRRRAMSIAPDRSSGTSSVGAAPAGTPVSMSLLQSYAVFVAGFYRHGAPTALGRRARGPGAFRQPAAFQNPICAIWSICGSSIRDIRGNP